MSVNGFKVNGNTLRYDYRYLDNTPDFEGATAEDYNSTKTYNIGDYVWYNGVLYRCISDITTSETWTAEHWTAAVLGNDVGELKSALNAGFVGVFQVSSLSYAVGGGTSNLERYPFEVYLNPGTYEISCEQDVTLTSADRNRFFYSFNGSKTYESNDRLEAGIHTWKFEVSTSGTYFLGIWVANPSANVTLSNFALVQYSVPTIIGETLNNLSKYGIVGFSSNGVPTFSVGSGNAITVTLPARESVLVSYPVTLSQYRSWEYKTATPASIVVDDGKTLIYDLENEQFVATTEPEYTTTKSIICFLNFKGSIYGQWERYSVKKQIEDVKSEFPDALPSYYSTYLNDKIDTINTNLMESTNGDSFVFITDIHVNGNAMNSPGLIKNIIDKTSIDKIILNGDYIQQEASKALALRKINDVISRYKFENAQTYVVEGNHEFNTNGTISPAPQLTWQELYYPIVKDVENKVVRQSDGLGYYWLNEAQKIKYMVATYNHASGMDYASCRFIIENLTNTPAGYTIVFMNHGGVDPNGTLQSGMDEIVAALDAIRSKTTYAFSGISCDFSNATYTAACVIVGHQHEDYSTTTASGLPLIAVTTDAFLYDSTGTTRTEGTTSEQAFDVFTINTTAKTIKAVRIGAGSDRSFTY